jgi:uncharacterized membrane protein (UPF0136 family)
MFIHGVLGFYEAISSVTSYSWAILGLLFALAQLVGGSKGVKFATE